jgi:hypothetical protein
LRGMINLWWFFVLSSPPVVKAKNSAFMPKLEIQYCHSKGDPLWTRNLVQICFGTINSVKLKKARTNGELAEQTWYALIHDHHSIKSQIPCTMVIFLLKFGKKGLSWRFPCRQGPADASNNHRQDTSKPASGKSCARCLPTAGQSLWLTLLKITAYYDEFVIDTHKLVDNLGILPA